MKNYHKTLKKKVNKRTRIKIYKQAIELLKTNQPHFDMDKGLPLCLLLPCILYQLDHYLQSNPDGTSFNYKDTPIAFPELTPERIEFIESHYDKHWSEVDAVRIGVLEEMLVELERQ